MEARERKNGQAMVETALVLPLVLLILLGIAQFGLIINAQLTLQNSAREAARLGATGVGDQAVTGRVYSTASILDPSRFNITVTPVESSRTQGSNITVRVNYQMEIVVPIISQIIGSQLTMASEVTMRVE